MGDFSPEKRAGCGLFNAVFGRKSFWPRRSTSTGSLPSAHASSYLKRRKSSSDDSAFFEDLPRNNSVPERQQKPITSAPIHPKIPPVVQNRNNLQHPRKQPPPPEEVAEMNHQDYPNHHAAAARKVTKDKVTLSGELESMITDYQKSKTSNTFVRASSGNVMLYSNLGNLRQPGGGGGGGNNTNSYNVVVDQLPKTAREEIHASNGKYKNNANNVKPASATKPTVEQGGSLCRALSTRMDPEQLKIMGNEDYKNGKFAEALALYDAAISIDPDKASYRSNKSAALTALGRLLEAVFECREAIRIEPNYHRAHHRLANLNLRLGELDKAIYHYKHAGPEADHVDISKATAVQAHLHKCTEAKRNRDWNTLIKVTEAAIAAGSDSAPQIYALKAEALLRLHRHQEADQVLTSGPHFEVDDCTKFFGPIGNANLLVIRSQVDLVMGRFDNALAAAQKATRLDSNNREASNLLRKAGAVAAARSKGNQLFKASQFYEASMAYGEGLDLDPYNSVLLCNRAACRSKLSQYEKAVEDCSAALNLRPNYTKARLRRADCYAKLKKWEAAIQDYEILQREAPEDEEVIRGLSECRAQLKKERGL